MAAAGLATAALLRMVCVPCYARHRQPMLRLHQERLALSLVMRAEEFKELLEVQPFVPLRIHMSDGKTFDIHHPDTVLVLRSRIDIGVPAEPPARILDRVEHCSMLHVVRVEELTNGKPA